MFEKTQAELDEEREQAEFKEKHEKENLAKEQKALRTFVRLPSKLPKEDPDWMLKKFRGESLFADEIEEYMKWKHEYKLSRFKKILKGVHQGTLIKVH